MIDPIEPRPKTILFIEDQELHYEQVAAYLRLHGYQCRRIARAEPGRSGAQPSNSNRLRPWLTLFS